MKANVSIYNTEDENSVKVTQNNELLIISEIEDARDYGDLFECTNSFPSVTTTSTVKIYVPKHATSTSKYILKLKNIQYSGDVEIKMFKNPTVSANGTEITTYNHDTTSSETFPVKIYHTPTSSSDGTQIIPTHNLLASEALPNRTQINNGDLKEGRVISLDNSYMITIKNTSASTQNIYVTFGFIIDRV